MNREHLFILLLDEQRYALRLSSVDRVVRMVEIAPLPKAPASLLGLVNVQGEVLPVVDLRSCFQHPRRPPDPQDVLVITGGPGRQVALAADGVGGVLPFYPESLTAESEFMRHAQLLEGVLKLPEGLVLVFELEKVLEICTPAAEPGEPAARSQRSAEGAGERARAARGGESPADRQRREILRERARKLAREPQRVEEEERLELVEFILSDERYAVESSFIREVYPLKELTPLPCTPPFVLGIVNLRGKILSVVDLRKFFDLGDKGLSNLNKLLVLHEGEMEFGLLADAIVGVRTLPARELQPSLPTLTEIRADYLKGVSKDRLVVLDAGKILADRRLVVHEEA